MFILSFFRTTPTQGLGPGKPGNLKGSFPVMEMTWKLIKMTKCPGNNFFVLEIFQQFCFLLFQFETTHCL